MIEDLEPGNKYKVWQPLLLALAMVAGMFIGFMLAKDMDSPSFRKIQSNQNAKGSVDEIMKYIDAKYVDEVEQEAIIENAIENIINILCINVFHYFIY
ncbi:MAG: hypothetical protein AAGK97_06250, partial [Bacteroidota bacterium]